jgi:hypothetical protein
MQTVIPESFHVTYRKTYRHTPVSLYVNGIHIPTCKWPARQVDRSRESVESASWYTWVRSCFLLIACLAIFLQLHTRPSIDTGRSKRSNVLTPGSNLEQHDIHALEQGLGCFLEHEIREGWVRMRIQELESREIHEEVCKVEEISTRLTSFCTHTHTHTHTRIHTYYIQFDFICKS